MRRRRASRREMVVRVVLSKESLTIAVDVDPMFANLKLRCDACLYMSNVKEQCAENVSRAEECNVVPNKAEGSAVVAFSAGREKAVD